MSGELYHAATDAAFAVAYGSDAHGNGVVSRANGYAGRPARLKLDAYKYARCWVQAISSAGRSP